jgi:hypothetical protein
MGRLVGAASGSSQSSQLRTFLDQVRNRTAFHYDRTRLWEGYRSFFSSERSAFNERAYVSWGRSAESTRFYFADAAAQHAYEGFDPQRRLFEEANDQLRAMNVGLRGIIEAYLTIRW